MWNKLSVLLYVRKSGHELLHICCRMLRSEQASSPGSTGDSQYDKRERESERTIDRSFSVDSYRCSQSINSSSIDCTGTCFEEHCSDLFITTAMTIDDSSPREEDAPSLSSSSTKQRPYWRISFSIGVLAVDLLVLLNLLTPLIPWIQHVSGETVDRFTFYGALIDLCALAL
jgi:hypothetical protein